MDANASVEKSAMEASIIAAIAAYEKKYPVKVTEIVYQRSRGYTKAATEGGKPKVERKCKLTIQVI